MGKFTFTEKMSGTRVDGFEHINPDEVLGLDITTGRALPLGNLSTTEAVEFVVKHYNLQTFSPPDRKKWVGTYLDMDDEIKVAIMEAFPEEKEELIAYFGENWADYYIRFGH